MHNALSEEVIVELTQEIWSSLLSDEGGLLRGAAESDDISATIEISGEWNGTTCVSCSSRAGRHAASVMFEMDPAEVSEEEVDDAVGELVNVVGGNIKSLLPGPTVMSLPSVAHGAPASVSGHVRLAQEVKFTWMDEPVVVTVWTNEES